MGGAVKLTGATGLIGWPEVTESGISARCLLNPGIKAGLVEPASIGVRAAKT
jgi:hypothetical protein